MLKQRLIIDASSILRACHYAGKDQEFGRNVTFDGKQVWVNSGGHGYENFVTAYKAILLLTATQPHQTILVKDGVDSRQFRRMLYPEYKGKRKPSAPELQEEFNALMAGVEDEILAMGGSVMEQRGMEADDVIAYLCQNLEGYKTVWSRDGDMLALRSEFVSVYLKDTMDPELHESCPAEYVLLYKALVGDPSDNLPGAKGFGKQAFVDMVLKYGYEGLDNLRVLIEQRRIPELEEDVADFKPLRKVIDNAAMVYTSYLCAKFYPERINTARAPLMITTGKCEQWDPQERHWEFKEYFGTKTLITADNFVSEAARLTPLFKATPYYALDIETSATAEGEAWCKAINDSKKGRKSEVIDTFGSQLTGLSLTFGPNLQHTVYFSVDHLDTANCLALQVKGFIDAAPDVPCVVHNSSFELPVLYNTWGEWLKNVWDSRDVKSYMDENTPHGLKGCAKQYFNYDQVTYEEVTQGRRMNQLTALEAFDYACDDTIVTAALFNRGLLTLELEHTLDTFKDIELETGYWVAEAFVNGIDVDLKLLKKLELEDDEIYEENWEKLRQYLFTVGWKGTSFEPYDLTPAGIKQAFFDMMGEKLDTLARLPDKIAQQCIIQGLPEFAPFILNDDYIGFNQFLEECFEPEPEFDINKDDHTRTLLYETLKLPIRFRTRVTDLQRKAGKKEGTPQADFSVMEHAFKLDVKEEEIAHDVLTWVRKMNQASTRRQLYYRPYPLLVHWKDGKLHPNFGKNSTATRRFAPNNPNINQLPKKHEGLKIRTIFSAPPGWIFVDMDFSGQELRLAAEASGDEALTSCYIGDNPRDPHSLTGAGIAEREGSEFGEYALFEAARADGNKEVKKYRDAGKGTNFSSQYLCRAPKLAKMLVVPTEEAQKFLDAKNAVYWGLAQWQQDTIQKAHAQGYTETRMGVRRHLHHKLSSHDKWESAEAERQGVNFEIQGSGAEMTKLAINAMHKTPRGNWRFVMPVHDETVSLVKIDYLFDIAPQLHACMVQGYGGMTIPLESEAKIGRNLGELVTVGTSVTRETLEAALKKLK